MRALALVILLFFTINETAEARRRFGRSFGKRTSRSIFNSKPAKKSNHFNRQSQRSNPKQARPLNNSPLSRRGGFMNSMMGAIAGTMIGGFIFRALGIGGFGANGGGGFGLIFPLLLIAGAYFFFRNRNKMRTQHAGHYQYSQPQDNMQYNTLETQESESFDSLNLANDTSFLKERNTDFFSIQHAWSKKDLSNVAQKLSTEVLNEFKSEFDEMNAKGHTSTLENIMINDSQLLESWTEENHDYAKVQFEVSLIEYESDQSGKVVSGLKGIPTDLTEVWVFSRENQGSDWKVCGIENEMLG